VIVKINVCDNCGQSKDIRNDIFSGICAWVYIEPIKNELTNKYFTEGHRYTFCCKECVLSFIKDNLSENGDWKKEENDDEKVPF